MWTMLLCWACGGNRFADSPLEVVRSSPWAELGLPEGRAVVSDADGLVVRYDHDDVGAVDREWRAALSGAGFEVVEDTSRDALVSCTWAKGEEGLALSVSEVRGATTVSLQVVP
ncbi:MAG: hypothetical protein R3F61_07265 [Myxococcota bacterium]